MTAPTPLGRLVAALRELTPERQDAAAAEMVDGPTEQMIARAVEIPRLYPRADVRACLGAASGGRS